MESMPPVPERTVSATHALALARYPDKAAHIGDGQTWTFTESHQRSLRIAGGLAALGVKRQQAVGLFLIVTVLGRLEGRPVGVLASNPRHLSGAMFAAAAKLTVPQVTVVLRKAYGLGAMAMAGGFLRASVLTVAWPNGEFGGLGLEGMVKLGYRRELDAIEDEEERGRRFAQRVAEFYERGKALSAASLFEIDDVINPADTRSVIAAALSRARVIS